MVRRDLFHLDIWLVDFVFRLHFDVVVFFLFAFMLDVIFAKFIRINFRLLEKIALNTIGLVHSFRLFSHIFVLLMRGAKQCMVECLLVVGQIFPCVRIDVECF